MNQAHAQATMGVVNRDSFLFRRVLNKQVQNPAFAGKALRLHGQPSCYGQYTTARCLVLWSASLPNLPQGVRQMPMPFFAFDSKLKDGQSKLQDGRSVQTSLMETSTQSMATILPGVVATMVHTCSQIYIQKECMYIHTRVRMYVCACVSIPIFTCTYE